jgi:hypothetical protein
LLPPVFLDYYLNDSGGYDLPRLPYISEVTYRRGLFRRSGAAPLSIRG